MKRGFSENKLDKNIIIPKKIKYTTREKAKSNQKNIDIKNRQNNQNNKDNKEKQNIKYNIDLFEGIKDAFDKDNNTNNIYLNFYNKNTKKQIFPKENKISKKFFDNNVEYIKEKQEKYRLKKEEEEKIKKQKEREDTNEYRNEQRAKLYKMEDVYKREIMKRKNKKLLPKLKEKITIFAKNKNEYINKKVDKNLEDNIKKESDGKEIKITRKEYDRKLDYFIKQSRLCLNELEKLPIANRTTRVYQREIQLNKYIKELEANIFKYQNHIGIAIIDD